MRAVAYGGALGVVLALAKGIVCVVFGCGGPITSIIRDVLLQLIDRVISGWALFPVGFGSLRSLAAALAANTVGFVVNAIRLAPLHSLCYIFSKVMRVVVRSVAGML